MKGRGKSVQRHVRVPDPFPASGDRSYGQNSRSLHSRHIFPAYVSDFLSGTFSGLLLRLFSVPAALDQSLHPYRWQPDLRSVYDRFFLRAFYIHRLCSGSHGLSVRPDQQWLTRRASPTFVPRSSASAGVLRIGRLPDLPVSRRSWFPSARFLCCTKYAGNLSGYSLPFSWFFPDGSAHRE